MLFMGYDVLCSYSYRVMRDADIPIMRTTVKICLLKLKRALRNVKEAV